MSKHSRYAIRLVLVISFALVALLVVAGLQQRVLNANDDDCVILIEAEPHHLGNDFAGDWLVPAPEGTSWAEAIDLPALEAYAEPLLLRFEVFHTESSNVYVNGEPTGINNGNRERWDWRGATLSRPLLMPTNNLIYFISGDNGTDDFMFRNVALVTCFIQVEEAAHHLGDDFVEAYIRPQPEGVSWSKTIQLDEPGKNIAMISLDIAGVDRSSVLVNGQQIGTISGSNRDIWENRTVLFDGGILTAGENRIEIVASKNGSWDDIQFKNVRLYHEATSSETIFLPNIIREHSGR